MASRTSTELVFPEREEIRLPAVLAALGDPVRLTIVAHLIGLGRNGESACVSFALSISKSTLSRHFKVLREAGVIRQRDEGNRRLNRLRTEDLEARFPGLLRMIEAHAEKELTGSAAADLAALGYRPDRPTVSQCASQAAEERRPATPDPVPDGTPA
ncbi:ArsR/SmtB family transcription factor [Actinacidiphila guanduensis]|uniref:DNA-binding transcriptional regulator, ArsR family n=1 Tax=Actinacidiphila guanduensis TaxID=310781 RepID=A0A1H0QJW0_9ACTN|nr:metalloregulator ArsR/SmtB family transcription factor [Actinacidiphila guanduensis]SDP17480.1 DNA-binding transcriptional regulator, ArsR family [Actinacidiphila guanduensis]